MPVGGGGGQGGCIEVIVKFEEKSREEVWSGSLVGGCSRVEEWVDVNKEFVLFCFDSCLTCQ